METTKIDEEYSASSNHFKDKLEEYTEIIKQLKLVDEMFTEEYFSGAVANNYKKQFKEFFPNFMAGYELLLKSSNDYDKALNNILDLDEEVKKA